MTPPLKNIQHFVGQLQQQATMPCPPCSEAKPVHTCRWNEMTFWLNHCILFKCRFRMWHLFFCVCFSTSSWPCLGTTTEPKSSANYFWKMTTSLISCTWAKRYQNKNKIKLLTEAKKNQKKYTEYLQNYRRRRPSRL